MNLLQLEPQQVHRKTVRKAYAIPQNTPVRVLYQRQQFIDKILANDDDKLYSGPSTSRYTVAMDFHSFSKI